MAAVLLLFAWKGANVTIPWPPADTPNAVVPKPDQSIMAWAEPLRVVLPKMLPADREYLSRLYDAMSFVLIRDGGRDEPIISTTDKFVVFHAGTLRLAIDKAKVGQYPGLGEAIDRTFVNAIGADARPLSPEDRTKLTAACSVLAYVFKVGGDG